MASRNKAPIVRLEPDRNKIVASIWFIISAAKRMRRQVSQYDIAKTLFLADRMHLNRYGRPITFDNYAAMRHGPVPSFAYELLKGSEPAIKQIGGQLPWVREPIANSRSFSFLPAQEIDDEILSPSEQELLLSALDIVKSLGFAQVRKLTHEDPAYVDAWEDEGTDGGRYWKSLGMLFDVPNMPLAAELAFISKNAM
jgi:uncharacterized phage-associated protein